MLLSLAACGGSTDPVQGAASSGSQSAGSGHAQESSGSQAESQPAGSGSAGISPAPETPPGEEQPAFDASWASNTMEALIPEPPFTILCVGSDYFYVDETEGVARGFGGKNETTWEEIEAYGQLLVSCGFTEYAKSGKVESDPAISVHEVCGLNPDTLCYVIVTHYELPVGNAITFNYGWNEDTTSMVRILIYDMSRMGYVPNSLGAQGYTLPG